jgi:hypothetical protein
MSVEAQETLLLFDPTRVDSSRQLPVRFQLCTRPTERNVIGSCFTLVWWIRACLQSTASHRSRLWIYLIATVIFLPITAATCSVTTFGITLFACPSSGPSLPAFGKAGPWSLSAGGTWTFEMVSVVTLCWFRIFYRFVREINTDGGRFRIQMLRKNQACQEGE